MYRVSLWNCEKDLLVEGAELSEFQLTIINEKFVKNKNGRV